MTETATKKKPVTGKPAAAKAPAKAPAKAATGKEAPIARRPEGGYSVADLAESMGKAEHLVRAQLRRKAIEKSEAGVYHWAKKADFDAVLAKLKSSD